MTTDTKKIILVVEDDVSLRKILVDKLRHENFSVLVAGNGDEGLKMALKNKPDLILLDIIMPRMNGIEMLKKLREDQWGKSASVLLLTNDDDPEHMKEILLKEDALDYLIKADWDLNSVLNIIRIKLKL